MIKVIKKDGRIQDFDSAKIVMSITKSADRIKNYLNKSDLCQISIDVERILMKIRNDGSNTSTYEIRGIIIDVLIQLGFKKVANSYYEGRMSK